MAALPKIVLLVLLFVGGGFALLWMGLVPSALSPLGRLSLGERDQWFVDTKLAMLRYDPVLCRAVLDRRYVDAAVRPDKRLQDGCGWTNSVGFTRISGVRMQVHTLTCETTAALALWVMHDVQPAAMRLLGSRVAMIDHMGSYSCRNISGTERRSQHATANAIDVSGFTLKDGRNISVARNWTGNSAESQFLREVHRGACRYFRLALGPAFNAAHADHFHFDRGFFWTCR